MVLKENGRTTTNLEGLLTRHPDIGVYVLVVFKEVPIFLAGVHYFGADLMVRTCSHFNPWSPLMLWAYFQTPSNSDQASTKVFVVLILLPVQSAESFCQLLMRSNEISFLYIFFGPG